MLGVAPAAHAAGSGGTLTAWGDNHLGQTDVPSGTFTAVAAGSVHNVAIRSDGTLTAWGVAPGDYGWRGQTNVPSGTFTSVAAGSGHNVAIRSNGTLAAWGDNTKGQTNVPSGTFIAVAAGYEHSVAIRSNGTLVAWGDNQYGQRNVPSGIFTAVAAGYGHNVAIRSNGTLAVWGDNFFGATNVPSGTFTAVAAGYAHSLAIRTNGTLAAWGDNVQGPWSNGQTDVPSGTFTSVAAGWSHSVGIRSDGTLAVWGEQLAALDVDPNVYDGFGPLNVPSGTFAAVAAGQSHSVAIREPGTFSDVPPGTQFYREISWLAGEGVSTGWPDGTFRPVQPVNRDAMAAFMYRFAGSPDFQTPPVSPFADVTPQTQFYKEICWLAEQGISTGWDEPDGTKTFRPVQPVNRDAMAAFMYRFSGNPAHTPPGVSPFADVTPATQFYNEITWLAQQRISTGWPEAGGSYTFRPVQPVNRDAMAAFMHRLDGVVNR